MTKYYVVINYSNMQSRKFEVNKDLPISIELVRVLQENSIGLSEDDTISFTSI